MLVFDHILFSDCGSFPSIKNAETRILKYASMNFNNKTAVSVKYVCQKEYYYTLNNPIVNCTESGFDTKFGKCVKGNFYMF